MVGAGDQHTQVGGFPETRNRKRECITAALMRTNGKALPTHATYLVVFWVTRSV